MSGADVALVQRLTSLQAIPLVPELPLLLATDAFDIWAEVERHVSGPAPNRPFWAFAWPGGQAKARFILDTPELVRGRRVLDIGTGSGIGALAAALAGAREVLANDIDPLALVAAKENAALTGSRLEVSNEDLLAGDGLDYDVVLLSDVVYEPELEVRVARFVEAVLKRGATILYADRSTARLPAQPVERMATYETRVVPMLDESHIEQAIVWRLA